MTPIVLDASAGVEIALQTPIGRVPQSRVPAALRHNLTIADALYVVVARHLHAPLVTTDLRLAASRVLRVRTITP